MTDQIIEELRNLTTALRLGKQRLWSVADLCIYFGLGETTVRQQIICRTDFPHPVQVVDGQKGRRWVPDEVEAWAGHRRGTLPRPRSRAA